MNEKMYSKVTEKAASKFKDAAAWIVDVKCTEPETDIKIIGEHRDVLIEEFSFDMALGSSMTKNKYLAIGLVSGLIISSTVVIAYAILKKCQNDGKLQKDNE